MDRRSLLATGGALAVATAMPTLPASAQGGSGDAAFKALLDRIFYDRLADGGIL